MREIIKDMPWRKSCKNCETQFKFNPKQDQTYCDDCTERFVGKAFELLDKKSLTMDEGLELIEIGRLK